MMTIWIDLNNLKSLEACRDRIREVAKNAAPGKWIIGRGWNHHLWQGEQEPDRHDLDALLPDNPAMMIRTCGHSIWVNSKALQAANINRDTPEPPGGTIDRDEHGEPTGIIREARYLMENCIPPVTEEDRQNIALAAQQEMLRFGITGIRSMERFENWETLAEVDRQGQLKLRIYHLFPPEKIEEAVSRGLTPGQGSEHLRLVPGAAFDVGRGDCRFYDTPSLDLATRRGVRHACSWEKRATPKR